MRVRSASEALDLFVAKPSCWRCAGDTHMYLKRHWLREGKRSMTLTTWPLLRDRKLQLFVAGGCRGPHHPTTSQDCEGRETLRIRVRKHQLFARRCESVTSPRPRTGRHPGFTGGSSNSPRAGVGLAHHPVVDGGTLAFRRQLLRVVAAWCESETQNGTVLDASSASRREAVDDTQPRPELAIC